MTKNFEHPVFTLLGQELAVYIKIRPCRIVVSFLQVLWERRSVEFFAIPIKSPQLRPRLKKKEEMKKKKFIIFQKKPRPSAKMNAPGQMHGDLGAGRSVLETKITAFSSCLGRPRESLLFSLSQITHLKLS